MNFAIRPADLPADYPRIAELLNFALPTPVTGGQLADDDAQLPAGSIKTQIVAVDSTGMPIGYAEVHRYPNTKVGKFYISLVVAPAVRRQGAGAALLSEIERLALGHGASYLSGDVCDQDPAALAFVERRGYQVKRIGVDSALDLTAWSGAPFAEVPAQVLASGIRIFQPAPGAERSVYALMEETVADLPGYEAQAYMSFETWRHAFCKPGGHIIVAADISGPSDRPGLEAGRHRVGPECRRPHHDHRQRFPERPHAGRQPAAGLRAGVDLL